MNVKLRSIKQIIWEQAQNLISNTKSPLPYSTRFDFFDGDNTILTKLEISQNTLVGLVDIDVFVENLPVEISNQTGVVTLVFSIPQNNSPVSKISIESWSKELDPYVEELQIKLVNDCNNEE